MTAFKIVSSKLGNLIAVLVQSPKTKVMYRVCIFILCNRNVAVSY